MPKSPNMVSFLFSLLYLRSCKRKKLIGDSQALLLSADVGFPRHIFFKRLIAQGFFKIFFFFFFKKKACHFQDTGLVTTIISNVCNLSVGNYHSVSHLNEIALFRSKYPSPLTGAI